MPIVWIASYPKSGNTWVRFLLANYFLGGVSSSRDVARCIPDIHVQGQFPPAQPWLTPTSGRMMAKTHYSWTPSHPGAGDTAAYIYVVRNPKDLLLSALNYRRLEELERPGAVGIFSDEHYARTFIASGGDPMWKRLGYGTWEEHTTGWLSRTEVPHLCFRYRDLRGDPAGALRAMLTLLGEPTDESRVAEAVRNSTFENLRALEIREKHSGESTGVFSGGKSAMRKGRFFMNKGAMGQTLGHIAQGLDGAFDQRFGTAMQKLKVAFPAAALMLLTDLPPIG